MASVRKQIEREVGRSLTTQVLSKLEGAERERNELLEAIEAHRAEKAHGATANMEHADDHLYTLADRIRGEGRSR